MTAAGKKPYAYSVAEWTRQPSSFEAIFGLELPYRPPKNPIAACIWRWRLWGEVTFALSMLQPWEKLLTLVALYAFVILFLATLMIYFPPHVTIIRGRALYYLLGQDAVDAGISESLQRLLAGWNGNGTVVTSAVVGEL